MVWSTKHSGEKISTWKYGDDKEDNLDWKNYDDDVDDDADDADDDEEDEADDDEEVGRLCPESGSRGYNSCRNSEAQSLSCRR